jgi:hypothetical protein
MNQNPTSACSPEVVSDCARMLVGAYRRNDAEDPALFIRAAATVLAGYPENVVRRVTHPATGLPSRLKFLPSIAEIRDACEEAMKPIYAAQREERLKAKNAALLAPPAVTAEERQRATDKWFNEIRPTFQVSDRPAPDTPEQAKAKLRALRADLDDAAFESFWIGLGTHTPKSTFEPLKG